MATTVFEAIYPRVCGLDVHKQSVAACIRRLLEGGRVEQEVRSFGTTTRELLKLSEWLQAAGVTQVAMESTGVYWKPVYNLLEGVFEVLLVNAQHIKQVPGRKTDIRDCQWIAQLLQCGLLHKSFVPPRPVRDLRDLSRHRAKLAQERVSVSNRVHKVLEDANIKLASVASDVLGKSGRAMLDKLISGERNPVTLAELARGQLRNKLPELQVALEGRFSEHHRFLLETILKQLDFLSELIEQVDARIEQVTAASPFEQAVALVATIPGVKQRSAENVLAETGIELQAQFGSAKRLAAWSGICPGNHESAGKRKSGATPKANRWLRRALTEAAWAATKTKNTYLSAQYRRLAPRRGKKRALVAVAHSILTIIYHLLTKQVPYAELGADYFGRLDPERLVRYHFRKLQQLGYTVALTTKAVPA